MSIFVWCGITNGALEPESSMLLSKARSLSDHVTAVVIGGKPRPTDLKGADKVLWTSESGLAWRKGELLTQMLREFDPEIVLFPAASFASQVAAHAAVSMETGLCADCTDLRMDSELFVMHRPAFGGGVEADIVCPNHRPQMATVRPGVFSPFEVPDILPELVEFFPAPLPADPVEQVASLCLSASKHLSNAQIIVAGGLGVGSKEGFALLQQLADKLGGQIGATRAAVDAGFVPWKQQVGQTGSIVNPRLYLAFGISGAIQHIAGMHGSECIISVNTDPKAPIFAYSDYTIVGDWRDVAQKLLEAL